MSTCQRCKTAFTCGMTDSSDNAPCWCTTLPALPPANYQNADGCYCPGCLRELVEEVRKASDPNNK